MKSKSKERQIAKLENRWFALRGNPVKQKRIELRIKTLENTK